MGRHGFGGRLVALALAGVLFVGGCNGAEGDSGPAGTPPCLVDADCPSGQRCDLGVCVLAEVPEDAGTPDGGGGADAGPTCRPPCVGRQQCDLPTGRCLEPADCLGAEDCLAGRVCLEGACADACTPETCPSGVVCDPTQGGCVAPPECTPDGACAQPDWSCQHGVCLPPCSLGGCPSPIQTCDPDSDLCQEPRICGTDVDCLGDRVCLDRGCADPEPGCQQDSDCEGGWVCGADSRCVPPATCTSDADCAPLLCDEERQRCEACVIDQDCPGQQVCRRGEGAERNRCAEPARCQDDEDCLGSRICQDGLCLPAAACDDDPLQGNDAPARAARLEPGEHGPWVRCDRVEDWFVVALREGEGLEAELRFDPAVDLSLALFAANDPFVPLDLSDGALGTERVALGVAPRAADYLLRVSGGPGQQGDYSLTVGVMAGFCAPDQLEAGGGNDGPNTATPVAGGEGELLGLSICPGDEDWFSLRPARAASLRVELAGPAERLELVLLSADGADEVAASAPGGEGRVLDVAELPAGSYRLRVRGELEPLGLSYSLRTSLRTAAVELQARCDQAPVLPFDQLLPGDTRRATPDFEPGCVDLLPGAAPEELFRIELAEETSIRASLPRTSFDAVLSLRADCMEPASELACALAPPATLFVPRLPPGSYTVLVDGVGAAAGTYELLVEAGAPGPVPGDDCAEPIPLALPAGEPLVVRGDTRAASPSFEPQGCVGGQAAAGRDLVYTVELPEPGRLWATLDETDFAGLLSLQAGGCGGDELRCSSEGVLDGQLVDAGVHALVVDGAGALQAGPFELSLRYEPLPEPPPNDLCAGALDVTPAELPGQRWIEGDTSAATAAYRSSCGQGEDADGGVDLVYSLRVDQPSELRVALQADAELLVRLEAAPCGAAGQPIACSDRAGALHVDSLAPGDYLLVVDGRDRTQKGPFTLDLNLSAAATACTAAAELSPGAPLVGDSGDGPRLDAGSCGGDGPEVAHRFVLDAPASVRLSVVAAFEPVLYVRGACATAVSEQACAAGAPVLELPSLPAGEYWAFVDAAGDRGGDYQLTLRLGPADERPENDLCGAAGLLPLQGGVQVQVAGTTAGARSEFGSACAADAAPDEGPDVLYAFTLDEPAALSMNLRPTFAGVLSLLRGTCADSVEVACVDADPDALASLQQALPAGEYLVVVTGAGPLQQGAFELTLQAEPSAPDLACAQATPLQAAVALAGDNGAGPDGLHASCSVEQLWDLPEAAYRIHLDEPASVRVRLLNNPHPGSLSLRTLCGAAASELACAQGADLEIGAAPAGDLWLVADGFVPPGGGSAAYELLLTLGPPQGPPPGDTCAAPLALPVDERGRAVAQASFAGAGDDHLVSCAQGAGPELVYALTLERESTVQAWVQAAFEATVALRAADCAAGADLACGAGVDSERLPAGSYHLLVQGPPGAVGELTLNVLQTAAPGNDDCASAEPLVFVADVAHAQGDLSAAEADSEASGCGLGPATRAGAELVYVLELPEPARLEVDVVAGFEAALYLRAAPCAAGAESACGRAMLSLDDPLPAGTWYLFVDAQGAGEGGPFDLTVRRLPVRPPRNDRCADAAPLPVPRGGARLVLEGALRDAADDYQPGGDGCPAALGAGPDVVFQLELPEPMGVRLVPPQDPELVAYLRADCDAGAWLGCLPAEQPIVPAGPALLFVDRPAAPEGAGAFSLELDAYPLPPNGECELASELTFDADGAANVAGRTLFASDALDAPGCTGPGAPDVVYAFELDETSDVSVSLQADFEARVHLLGAACSAEPLSCGPPAELVALPPGRYHLGVDGAQAEQQGSFVLDLQVRPAAAPANDTCGDAAAVAVPPGGGGVQLSGRLGGAHDDLQPGAPCPAGGTGADVVYAFELSEPMGVDVTLAAGFEAEIYLQAGCDAVQATQCWPGASGLLPAGDYRLVVDSSGPLPPGAAFDLSLLFVAAPDNGFCEQPQRLELDEGGHASVGADTRWAADRLDTPGCGGAGANELQYLLELDEPTDLLVQVEAPFRATVALHSGGCDGTLVACGPPRELPGLPAGAYHLSVDGAAAGEHGPFELSVHASPARARLLADKCAGAPRLGFDGRRAAVQGSTLGEDAVHATDGCPEGAGSAQSPEAVFLFTLEQVAPVTLRVLESERPVVVSLRTTPCGAGEELACGGGELPWSDLLLPAGDYAVIVDGDAPAGPGAFVAELVLGELADPKCEDAPALGPGDGGTTVSGTTDGASSLFAPSTCPDPGEAAASPEAVHALRLSRPATVSVEVLDAERRAAVYLLRGPCSDAQEQACGVGEAPLLGVQLPAGSFYVVVDGLQAAGVGDYTLRVTAAPVGVDCAHPRVVTVPAGGGLLELTGDTAGAGQQLQMAECAGDSAGPEEIWALDLSEPLSLVASLRSDGAASLRLLEGCEPPAALACGDRDAPLSADRLEAGRHLLVVDGPPPGAPYQTDLVFSALPQRCAEAAALQPGLSVAGSTVGADALLADLCEAEGSPQGLHPLHLDAPQWVTLALHDADFDAALTLLDGCSPLALALDCSDDAGRIVQPRLPAGDYLVVVQGQDGAAGNYQLRLETAPAVVPVGGDTCADRYPLQPPPATGQLSLVGTTSGRDDFFDTTALSGVAGDGPDTAFALSLDRRLDMEATLHTHGFPATFYLLLPDCHDGRAPLPWPLELGTVRRVIGVNGVENIIVGDMTPGDYSLVVDAADPGRTADFSLHLTLLEHGCTWSPFLLPGEEALGDTTDGGDRFSDGCGAALPPGPDSIHRLSLDAPGRVVLDVPESDFPPVLSLRRRCWAAVEPLACVRGSSLSVDVAEPGIYTVVVDSADGSAGAYRLTAQVD